MTEFQPQRFGKYLLLGRIAHGGMAELYRAKLIGAEGFEKLIAIKMILPHLAEEEILIQSFIEEAKLAAFLQHQNIVQIYDFGSVDGRYYIAMEYLYGKDLKGIIKRSIEKGICLSLENALYIATQVCAGLDYAHKLKDFQGRPLNIIHRDIGPHNVFVTYNGQVKVIDFGIAKAAIQDTTTQEGSIKGKVAYMSPEQAKGETIDHRSDIFAIGILLYEILTHKRMFEGDAFQVFAKVREADYVPANVVKRNLPVELYKIMERALAKDREQRYQFAEEMLTDLETCINRLSISPSFRSLSQYMNALFEDEAEAGVQMIQEATDIDYVTVTAQDKTISMQVEKTVVMADNNASRKQKSRLVMYVCIAIILFVGGIGIVLNRMESPLSLLDKLKEPFAVYDQTHSVAGSGLNTSTPVTQTGSMGPSESYDADEVTQPIMTFPDSPKLKKGIMLLREERFTEASALFEEILTTEPLVDDKVPVLYSKALVGKASGLLKADPERAKALLLKAVKIIPGNAQGHFHLGRIYTHQKDYTSAIASYQTAVELDPQMPGAYFNLGYIYARQKDLAKAEMMFGRAVELSPEFVDEALYNLALVQKKRGKLQPCIRNLEQAIAVNPGNNHAKKLLQQIKAELNKKG